jgi:hypothetical protein
VVKTPSRKSGDWLYKGTRRRNRSAHRRPQSANLSWRQPQDARDCTSFPVRARTKVRRPAEAQTRVARIMPALSV